MRRDTIDEEGSGTSEWFPQTIPSVHTMSDSPHLRDRDKHAIETTIGETLDLKHRPGEAGKLLLVGLKDLAQTYGPASILFATRMGTQKPGEFEYRGRLHLSGLGDEWIRRFDWRLQHGYSPVLVGMRSVRRVNQRGVSHVMTRPELVDKKTWEKSPIYKGDIAPLKISDQLFAWYQTQYYAVTFIIRAVDGQVYDEHAKVRIKTALDMMQDNPELMAVIRPENAQPQLSPQLVRVRNLLIHGLDYEQIRKRLASKRGTMSIETVKTHVKKLFQRYGIKGGRQELAREFYRLGGSTDRLLDEELKEELRISHGLTCKEETVDTAALPALV